MFVAAVAGVAVLLTTQGDDAAAPAPPPPAAEAEATFEPADESATAGLTGVPVITTIAGTGEATFSGDGGPATEAGLRRPTGLAFDDNGNLYVGDRNRVRRIDASGVITTVAGTGSVGFSGDGGPATEARFGTMADGLVATLDTQGNLYIADVVNQRVRKVDTSGIVTTIAGIGSPGSPGDGGPALEATLNFPNAVAVDEAGNIYVIEWGGHRVRKIDADGVIATIAGTGEQGYGGDGGPATEANLAHPSDIAIAADGSIYVADSDNHAIREISPAGNIRTIAGTGEPGYSGDRGRGFEAQLWRPQAIALDDEGNIYISDTTNNRIRKVDTEGFITTVVGTGRPGEAGDGGPATEAELALLQDSGIAVDDAGDLYIADAGNYRIREVTFADEP